MSQKEVNQVIEKIPEGSDVVMTLTEMYRKEGEKRGIVVVAKNLIRKGFSIKDIAEATGLDEEEIEKMKSEMQ